MAAEVRDRRASPRLFLFSNERLPVRLDEYSSLDARQSASLCPLQTNCTLVPKRTSSTQTAFRTSTSIRSVLVSHDVKANVDTKTTDDDPSSSSSATHIPFAKQGNVSSDNKALISSLHVLRVSILYRLCPPLRFRVSKYFC